MLVRTGGRLGGRQSLLHVPSGEALSFPGEPCPFPEGGVYPGAVGAGVLGTLGTLEAFGWWQKDCLVASDLGTALEKDSPEDCRGHLLLERVAFLGLWRSTCAPLSPAGRAPLPLLGRGGCWGRLSPASDDQDVTA